LTLAAAFSLDFPAPGLVAAVDLGSEFLGLAVFLVAVTFCFLGASLQLHTLKLIGYTWRKAKKL